MAVRLQMKLGVVAEQDRLPDSPDTIVVVEPSVGSVARSKGNLYLLVASRAGGHRLHEATRLVAETIRSDYYYDESAGIVVCLEKTIRSANKRLLHQRDRLGLGHHDGANGPVGVALAVIRGSELYVATVGPAEAYLIRQARLSTLPDPNRERGLPANELEPDVWRGEITVGDSLVLISANLMARIGPDELKNAMLTLHPQSAMEHLHHRFVADDGAGSDGAIALEATEVAATHKQRTLVPVRAAEPLAGAPDRSPIPLADSVTGGVAAVQAGARHARSAAGNAFDRVVRRLQDLLPQRSPRYRRVTPISSRVETQRRAAVAVLAFIALVGALGTAMYLYGSGPTTRPPLASLSAAQQALAQIHKDLDEVFGPGVDLVVNDPVRAQQLLTDAYAELGAAETAGVQASLLAPLRQQVIDGLDQLYRVVPVGATVAFSFEKADPPVDLAALVLGPDGVPYVLDRASRTVFRVDLKAKKATAVLRAGQAAGGTKAAEPRLIAVGGPDLLILDAKNVLWRWRPADTHGKGTLVRVKVKNAASWGDDVRAIGTFVRSADKALYNLYVVDPSEQQVLAYSPARDGSGYPAAPTGRLATAQALDDVDCMYIDGDIYLVQGGTIERFVGGKTGDWVAQSPGDTLLRPDPRYRCTSSASERGEGNLYAYDPRSARIVALVKKSGAYVEQYRLAGGDLSWTDLRAMYVVAGSDEQPPSLVWIDGKRLMSSRLEAVPEVAPSESAPSPSGSPSGSAGAGAFGSPAAGGSRAGGSPSAPASASPKASQ